MPLKSGYSQNSISSNIEEMMHKYKETGKIGNARPGSMEEARRMAAAAAYAQARKSAEKIKDSHRRAAMMRKLSKGKKG